MKSNNFGNQFAYILKKNRPQALALIKGNVENSNLKGIVKFYPAPYMGVLIEAEMFNLPDDSQANHSNFYAFHIHEYNDCSLPFDKTGGHYNPTDTIHPYHSGDMIPIMGNNGYAWLSFFDSRFEINDIIGKSVVIHSMRDDFTTQPSGNSGSKIGCGVIKQISVF